MASRNQLLHVGILFVVVSVCFLVPSTAAQKPSAQAESFNLTAKTANVGQPGGKVRPALVVQSDHNNARLNETMVAAITSNTSRVHEATQLLIDISTPEGAASGLLHDSAVRCERLHSIPQTDVRRVIGHLPDVLMLQVNDCLKAALELP